jgi:hypothetical protein
MTICEYIGITIGGLSNQIYTPHKKTDEMQIMEYK